MQLNKNNNLVALIIGFVLILLIAAVTIFRSPLVKNNSTSKNAPAPDPVTENLKKATKITSAELAKKILDREDIILLDIRDSDAYAKEHILGSKNVPLAKLADALGGLDKSSAYALIDSGTALDSTALAVSLMKDADFKNVFYLDGGFAAWKNNLNPTISDGDPNSFTDQSKVTYIQSDNLKNLLASESDLAIIDVRKSDQFNAGHIKGALNIFLDDLEKNKAQIPLGKKIIVYDKDGLWAFKAAVRLFDMGFFNTLALSDGLDTWKQKKYELVQ